MTGKFESVRPKQWSDIDKIKLYRSFLDTWITAEKGR